jgi:hypothetical protein
VVATASEDRLRDVTTVRMRGASTVQPRGSLPDAGKCTDAGLRHHAIMSVSRRQEQHQRATQFIDNRMKLGVSTTFGDAYRLRLRPPFPPLRSDAL